MPNFYFHIPVAGLSTLAAVTVSNSTVVPQPSQFWLKSPAAMSSPVATPATQDSVASASFADANGYAQPTSLSLAPVADSVSSEPMAALAASNSINAFLTQPASPTGSYVYQEVVLQTHTLWPNIDNISVNGGKGINAKGTVESSTVGPVNIDGAHQAFFSSDTSVIHSLAISNFKATDVQREGIRLRGEVDGVTIRNFAIQMRGKPQTKPDLPEGIAIYNGTRVTIEDGFISGFRMEDIDGEYTNGDGISAEEPVNNLTIRRVISNDNSDAGFDLKSNNTFLYDTRAERNFRNYRLWTKVTAGTIYSTDPRQAHIWVGDGAEVVIDKLIAVSNTPVYVIMAAPTAKSITIKSCQLSVTNAWKFFKGSSTTKLVLGPGCSLPR